MAINLNKHDSLKKISVKSSENNEDKPLKLRHGNELMNEFTNFRHIMEGAFFNLFLIGYPFTNKIPTQDDMTYMLMQADNRFSDNLILNAYLFNLRNRVLAVRSVNKLFKYSPLTLRVLQDLLDKDNLLEKLKQATSNPKHKDAKVLANKLSPLLQRAGKDIPYGNSGSGKKAFGILINMNRFFGNFGKSIK
jgi:hypothetical protein